ncbi:hypothetical protein JCM16777_0845 [Leptotrichia wadei]|uniref:Uncharacterized protein n=1 Tax=Leptotrichia wadei TaxID=157687 RepID=A0A7U6LA58_9FUSO|nr:hypothetical protein [Leptotrichia wadei]BBM42596.1 hypothetical protein JCM16777_0845 [Leptotrichia wadei]
MSDKEIIEAETVKENGNNPLKVIQLDMEYLKENAEEYLTDDEKFMDLLYSISDRSGVEKLLKMRFLSGGAVPLRDILWRSGKTKEELANYKVKFRKYGDKPEEKKTEDNIVRELLMSDVLEGSFRGWENERCTMDLSKYQWIGIGNSIKGSFGNCRWVSNDGHYNLKIKKTGEIYLKMRWFFVSNGSGNGYYTFKIDADDTENFMNFLIDIIYEKNVKADNLKNYFEDIY